MFPLAYTWPISLPFWAAFLWTALGELPMALRDNARPAAATDRGSKLVVQAATAAAAIFAFPAAAWLRAFAITAARVPIYASGVVLLAAAGALRRHCFRVLGASFTFDVRVAPDQQVVERGAYKYVRHPSYSAGFLAFGGIGLALGNWLSLAVLLIVPGLAYVYRIHVEETALARTLGAPYIDYMRRTRRLIPLLL